MLLIDVVIVFKDNILTGYRLNLRKKIKIKIISHFEQLRRYKKNFKEEN